MKKRSQSEAFQIAKRTRTSVADLRSAVAFPSPSSTTSFEPNEYSYGKPARTTDFQLESKFATLPPLQIIPACASNNFNEVNVNTPETPKYLSIPALLVPSPTPSTRSVEDLLCPNRELVNLMEREDLFLPSQEYVDKILKKPHTRSIQVQWITEIARKLRFIPETTFVAINFFDRYHSVRKVTFRRQNQLLAVTCVYMAGKLLEELLEPTIKEILGISGFDCTIAELKRMERKVVDALEWHLSPVTPFTLLDEMFNTLGHPSGRTNTRSVIKATIESTMIPLVFIALSDVELCTKPPSVLLRCFLDLIEIKRRFTTLLKISPAQYESFFPISEVSALTYVAGKVFYHSEIS